MLTENKFSKYLLYAIGEIVLVVIGILIAIQINNRNEARKLGIKEIKILKEIKTEQNHNVSQIKEYVGKIQNRLKSAEIIQNKILYKEPFNDSLLYHFKNATIQGSHLMKHSAFESLTSVGLEIISNDSIRQGVINIYTYTKSSINDFFPVNKEIGKLETILESHLMMDRVKLIANPELNVENQWGGFTEVPFKFINYDAFLKDERLGYSLINLIRVRWLNIKLYESYINLLQESNRSIEEELKGLENK